MSAPPTDTEKKLAGHYGHGGLAAAIDAALIAAGKDPARLVPADLAPVEEFHIGGRQATDDLTAQLGLKAGMEVLDIGSGIGGAARALAETRGCRVTGIDLTAEFVAVASDLARRVGLDHLVSFHQGSALALPFAAARFDAAVMLHVGMNIADKDALFAGIRRVLKPGGVFGLYDVMRVGAGDVAYPQPWSSDPATSFLADLPAHRRGLEGAGFTIIGERPRGDFAVTFFRRMRARAAESGLPPLGTHILMGDAYSRKIANMAAAVEAGVIAPVEVICRAG